MPFKGSREMEVRRSPDGQWAITHCDYDFVNETISFILEREFNLVREL